MAINRSRPKLLQLHSFAFALQCYKIGLMDLSLSHLKTAVVAGEQVGADRESSRVLLATRALCGITKGKDEPSPTSSTSDIAYLERQGDHLLLGEHVT